MTMVSVLDEGVSPSEARSSVTFGRYGSRPRTQEGMRYNTQLNLSAITKTGGSAYQLSLANLKSRVFSVNVVSHMRGRVVRLFSVY